MFVDDLRDIGHDMFEADRKEQEDDYTELEWMLMYYGINISDYSNMSKKERSQLWFSYRQEQ